MGINQGKIARLTGPSTNMKLLIVLGLIPLFSAQQLGFLGFPNMMGFRKAQGKGNAQARAQVQAPGTPKKYNQNNMWGLNNFPGFGSLSSAGGKKTYSSNGNNNQNQKDNLFGLPDINNQLVKQLRFMTDMLANTLEQVAEDPRANEVFKTMDKICVSNMEDTIEILKLGSTAAEKALLDSTKLLSDYVDGKVKFNKEGAEAARVQVEEAFNKLSGNSQTMKY